MAAVSVRSSPGPSDGPNSSRIDMPSASSGPSTAQAQQQPRPPFGQAFGGMSGPSGSGSGGAGSGQTIPVRPASPVKPDGAGQQVKPVAAARNDRPIDMRAEEDAARRLNVGRVSGNSKFSGTEARGKKTDLFGPALRIMLDRRAKNHQTTIDDEALAYLSKAAETRLREMLGSAVSVQQHRTTTSYLHPPPRPGGSGPGSSSSKSKPMWEVSINNDPNAVIDVLNRQSKDAEREFRTSRMERLAKEYEMDRVRERQAAINGGDLSLQASGSGSGSTIAMNNGPGPGYPHAESNEADSPGAHPPSSPDKGQASSPAASNAAPTFGGPRKVIPNKTIKKNPKDVSADVQIKMSNATAMRSAGMGKKYSWMSSAPQISSPLSGNKKKGKKGSGKSQLSSATTGGEGQGGEGDADANGEVDAEGEAEDVEMGNETKKRKPKHSKHTSGAGGAGGAAGSTTSKRRKKMPTLPPRRMIPTGQFDRQGIERLVPDDRALTVYDLVFSMEREKGGQGMGTSDEVVRRVMSRPGGVWGVAKNLVAGASAPGPGPTSGSGSGSLASAALGDRPK